MKYIASFLRFIAAWLIGLIVFVWRCTCRGLPVHDVRPEVRAAGKPFVWAMLHSHAINGTIFNDEKCVTTMLSRSKDGELLVPAFRLSRIHPMRGSTRTGKRDKGGQEALQQMVDYMPRCTASLMIVDGPLGPRNTIHRGVVDLARRTHAAIIPVIGLPSRRWIFTNTWDRLQLPKPFSTVRFIMGDPIYVEPIKEDSTGKHLAEDAAYTRSICEQIDRAIRQLEAEHDPREAAICAEIAKANQIKRQARSDRSPPTMPATVPNGPSGD